MEPLSEPLPLANRPVSVPSQVGDLAYNKTLGRPVGDVANNKTRGRPPDVAQAGAGARRVPLPRQAPPATLQLIQLNEQGPASLQEQLRVQLRQLILQSNLHPGQRLPSSRALAQRLGISRNTVLAAFDQLVGEGYLSGAHGSGTYVSTTLPEELLTVKRETPRTGSTAKKSAPRTALPPHLIAPAHRPFRGCIPSVAEFPIETWERLRRRVLNTRGTGLLNYGSPLGDTALREQIAIYLRDYRGVRCEAEQVVITTGAQQAFGLAAATLAPPGSGIWVEDPGYEDAWAAFSRSGLHLLHQPVDEHGLVVPRTRPAAAKLAYLTPSRQFPLGVTMSLDRRLEWLSFAAENKLWLIEDDYDSEFRYEGRPLPSLQGLVPGARVMYIGTFSKALYPSLRIAYAVVPAECLESFANAKYIADGSTPAIDQAVAAEFLREGHFVRHLRKMRTIYGERINVLQEAAQEHWRDHVEIRSTAAGLGVVGFLRRDAVDTDYAAVAAEAGYHVSALSTYAHQARVPPGLVLGFAAYSAAAIRRAVKELAAAWNVDPRTRE